MRIDGTTPIPALIPAHEELPQKAAPRPTNPEPKPEVKPEPVRVDNTSVVVEIQNSNTYVYKFVDSSTGQLIEQIPSQQLLNMASAIEASLPSLIKAEGKK